jgi:GWxTD domain-containing protein
MKTIISLLLLLSLPFSGIRALDLSVHHATFKGAGSDYVELHLHVVGSTVNFISIDSSTLQASLDIMVLFSQGDQIVRYDKFRLRSPKTAFPINFSDLHRYALEPGVYRLVVQVRDLNLPDNEAKYEADFELGYSRNQLEQSDILLLSHFRAENSESPFVRGGYFMEFLPFHFYPKEASRLSFFCEIYNADQAIGEDFVVSYSIEKEVGAQKKETVLIGHKRRSPEPVNTLLLQMDIDQLASGNYELVVEVRDRNRELLSEKRIRFKRSNPYLEASMESLSGTTLDEEFVSELDADQLRYSLKAIASRLPGTEVDILNRVLKDGNLKAQRLYLFSYWSRQNPNQPRVAYNEYMEMAQAVDKLFKSSFGHGFETDRGHIFLKYGRPDDIIEEYNDPSAPPYEIWLYHYFPTTKQTNVRFIFYNPTLAAGDFQLLHSTARGELNNPQWEIMLYRNTPNEMRGSTIDALEMEDNFGRQARQRFRDF